MNEFLVKHGIIHFLKCLTSAEKQALRCGQQQHSFQQPIKHCYKNTVISFHFPAMQISFHRVKKG